MFFRSFGTIEYSLEGFSKKTMNIVTAAILRRLNVDQTYVYRTHTVSDGQHYDSLSYELYKDGTWGWTILLVNGIVNPYTDWPMDANTLEEYTRKKWGSTEALVEFRYLDTGWVLDDVDSKKCIEIMERGDPLPINVTPISSFEYENEINNAKRDILVIDPKYIRKFVDAFEKEIERAS